MTDILTPYSTDTARRVPIRMLMPILFGALAGMRSVMPLTTIAMMRVDVGNDELQGFLALPILKRLLPMMAAGELVMDKLPFTPARTDVLPLMGRIGFGALVGALTYPKARWLGALLGALAAAGSTHLTYHLRKTISERSVIPDPIIALVEDTIVILSARHAAQAAKTLA